MFGKRLKKLREANKMSMRQLGELLGVAQTNVSNWENAGIEPNYETLIKISSIFNVSVDYLIGNAHQLENVDEKKRREISKLAKELYDEFYEIPENMRKEIETDLIKYIQFLGYKTKKE
ncbi:transcriptional regulator [Bacillus pseudomycoides]|uniref:helix-turn-helix domain-containing protein n=1 Tax=Bacillus pseudomycoides TaxID=64104 RepID=UPI000BF2C7A7|nr:helix-turn-helix transcriptional regulator [Bacillus pseudomycoides]PFX36773.1 transcriptional regulator [Bacillus pseudomycoides]